LVPSKNVSVEGRVEQSTGRAMIYLDTKAILETRFSDNIERSEAGYYCASIIYTLAVDGLNSLQNAKGKADNYSPPSDEMLWKCKEESEKTLKTVIVYCGEVERDTLAHLWEKKEALALEWARMDFTLLHGEYCTVWKGQDPLTRKRRGCSKLSFGGFTSFSVKREGERPQYFSCNDKDILSGEFYIEKTKKEEEKKAEEKATWEIVV